MKLALADHRFWILDPGRDLSLFVLSPLWILSLMWIARIRFDVNAFGIAVLAIGGIGHHLPGFIRAYTDPVLFRRYRTRFLLAPVFLISVCLVFSGLHLQSLKLILVLWGAWHGAMQINGFLRIYDSKVGSFSPATAWLDWAMCLVWFGGGLLHSSMRLLAIFSFYYSAGGPAISPDFFSLFRQTWDWMTAGITLVFLINAWRQTRAGKAPNPVKYLMMASSFGFWWFVMVHLDNLLVALVLFEIFHDVQYNALVWIYNERRVAKKMTASPVESFLFQPGLTRFALYGLLVLGYGCLGAFTDYSKVQVPQALQAGMVPVHFLTALFIASALLHFYFDGFIWRVRDGEFRKGLGIVPSDVKAAPAAPSIRFQSGWMASGWKWSLFVIPVLWLGISEYRGQGMPLSSQYENLARLMPESWQANFLLGVAEKSNGDFEGATEHIEKTVALHPDFEPAHALAADIYFHLGNTDLALNHYSQAASLDSNDFEMQDHFSTLLLSMNRVAEAIPHLKLAEQHEPNDADLVFLLGAALMQSNRAAEAVPYLYRTLDLDPRQKRALNYLGIAAQSSGNFPAAIQYFQRALDVDSQFQDARDNLARAKGLMDLQNRGPQ